MFPYQAQPVEDAGIRQRVLNDENGSLRAQVHSLSERVSQLEAENAHLRYLLTNVPPVPPPMQLSTGNGDRAIHLPMVVESLAVMQDHFGRQGTLKQW